MQNLLMTLWPDIPDDADPADNPGLTVYACQSNDNGASVLVLPGGGYGGLADHEGEHIAHWLNEHGFHAVVLQYRVAPHKHPAMINDAQRAMRLMRHFADRCGFRADAIGALGFSAGGHLASTLTVHHDKFTCDADDLRTQYSARPDATVLCYPVIDLGSEAAHTGSRGNLLGEDPDPELVELLSTQNHITANCPPTFAWHTATDGGVPVANSTMFAQGCWEKNVPCELHVYDHGDHGVGLADGSRAGGFKDDDLNTWGDLALRFLRRHLLDNKSQ